MTRGQNALALLLEHINGKHHTPDEIDLAKKTIVLELEWLEHYSKHIKKLEKELEGLK